MVRSTFKERLRSAAPRIPTTRKTEETDQTQTVPGPKPYPVIGTAYTINPRNLVQSATDLAVEHGRFYQHTIPGSAPLYIVSSFALVDELSDETRFTKVVHPAIDAVRGFAGNGLFTSETDDPEWGKAHRILMPAFNPVALQSMYDRMADIADQLMLKWSRTRPDDPIDVPGDFTRLTLDTIALCSFSFRFNSFYSEDFHPFVDAMVDGLAESGKRAHALEIQKKLDVLGERRFQQDIAVMKDTVDSLIRERRTHPSAPGEEDVLDVMLQARDPQTGEQLSDENLRYQLVTFLIAGHETTSGLLSFTIYELLKNPRVLDKARSITDAVLGGRFPEFSDLKDLGYLDQILREALRKYPTAPGYAVTPFETTTIGENGGTGGAPVTVNPGDTLFVLLGHMHRDPEVWDNPEEFRPERFDFDNAKKIPHNAWKPFGNGQRSCLGRAFALQEATMVLALLIQHFDFRFTDPDYELKMLDGLTSKPEDLFINVLPREGFPYGGRLGAAAKPAQGAASGEVGTEADFDVEPNGHALRIFVGSNAGTSRNFARKLSNFARSQGFATQIDDLDDAVDSLEAGDIVLIATSSYEGLAPDNAKKFVDWVTGAAEPDLSGVRFAVFGSGNSEWAETFQRIPRVVDEALEARGATRLVERGAADVRGDYLNAFETWSEQLWEVLAGELSVEIDTTRDTEAVEATVVDRGRREVLSRDSEGEFVEARIVDVVKLSTDADGPISEKFRVDLELPEGTRYTTGDYLEVLPSNPEQVVNRVLARFGLSGEDRVELSGTSSFLPTGQPLTVRELLSNYVELSAPVSRRHIDAIAGACVCPPEQEKLRGLADADLFAAVAQRRTSILDILEEYPSIQLSFGQFLSMLGPLTPRRYSISSSAEASPRLVSLTFSRIDAPAWSGRGTFAGVASNFLAGQKPGNKVLVAVAPGNEHFRAEADPATPMIMVGAGTGIAPLRAFVEDTAHRAQKQGVEPAPSLLFYGCHGPESDFLYRDELAAWQEEGFVDVRTAFSRANTAEGCAAYVQDRLFADRRDVIDYLDRGARVLVCGDAEKMAPAVRRTMADIIAEHRDIPAEEAAAEVERMERHLFTYVTDAFS